jgi:hypothetical protein
VQERLQESPWLLPVAQQLIQHYLARDAAMEESLTALGTLDEPAEKCAHRAANVACDFFFFFLSNWMLWAGQGQD